MKAVVLNFETGIVEILDFKDKDGFYIDEYILRHYPNGAVQYIIDPKKIVKVRV